MNWSTPNRYGAFSIPGARLPAEMYIRGPRYKLEFYAYETMGGSIGNTQGLARARFDTYRRFTLDIKCTMERDKLLDIVRKNREQHITMRDEALAGFCAKTAEKLEGEAQKLRDGKAIRVDIRAWPPANHVADYDRVIRMLELTTDTVIELNEHDFATLVNDDWDWARDWFHANNSMSKTCAAWGKSKGYCE